jgi:uncharacterized protein
MKKVKIADIIERQGDNKYSLLLMEEDGHKAFVINVGMNEAFAIVEGIKKTESQRPKTHQLMLNLLKKTNFKLKEIIITETKEKIFYSVVKFYNKTEELEMDARPSDAVALAVHMDAPISVSAKVFDEFAYYVPYSVKNPNQNGIKSIAEKMIKLNHESEIRRNSKTKKYIAETTKEIINQVFSN